MTRVSRQNTINEVIAFGGGCLLFGDAVVLQFWEAIMQKYFDDRFAPVFQNDHNNISDAVEQDRSAG